MKTDVLFQWKNENSQELEDIIVCNFKDDIIEFFHHCENFRFEIKK